MQNIKSVATFYFHLTDWNASKIKLKTIREKVFIHEQGVPIELEWDELDYTAHHVLAEVLVEGEKLAIGTARIIINNKLAHLGRMAVLPAWRERGIGTKILQTCIDDCHQQGIKKIVLNAQLYAIPFYQRAGFKISSEQFFDAGIPHKTMILSLNPKEKNP